MLDSGQRNGEWQVLDSGKRTHLAAAVIRLSFSNVPIYFTKLNSTGMGQLQLTFILQHETFRDNVILLLTKINQDRFLKAYAES